MTEDPVDKEPGRKLAWRLLMQVLWPAYLAAIVATGLLFSMIDPHELSIVGVHLADSREGAYTVGFLLLWACFSLASAMTFMLARDDCNRDRSGSARPTYDPEAGAPQAPPPAPAR